MVPPAAQESGPFGIERVCIEESLHGVAFFLIGIVNVVWKLDVLEVSSLINT
jgi:hypothetical protein